ncbi:MAG: AMP-binding protein [Acidobacteriota bacterium]|jgi:long-chain acyl-CoA synthetase
MNVTRSIERRAREESARSALLFEGGVWSYGALDAAAGRCAAGLRELGVERGARVGLLLPNVPEFAIAYLGVQKLGAITVAVNPSLSAAEAGTLFRDSGARVVIAGGELRGRLPDGELPDLGTVVVTGRAESARPADLSWDELLAGGPADVPGLEMDPDDPAAIVYTSGTTGRPKGAVLSHGNVTSNVEAKRRHLGLHAEDRLILFLPLYHCFGQNAVLLSGLHAGATVILHRRFDPERVLSSVAVHRVTRFFGVPTTYRILLERATPEELATVTYYFSAAASLPRDLEDRWRERFGRPIHQGYGLTETSPFASYNHDREHRPGSIGTPIDGVEMKVVDVSDGRDLPAGEVGEILVRGSNVMSGYWNRPEETAEALRGGWFHTGDLGWRDADGYFHLHDRLKDLVNVGGQKVFPAEVEACLRSHPAVAEAAVYGAPDPVLGERVCAAVVLRAQTPAHPVPTDELLALCRERLAGFKVPTEIERVDEIPRNPTGKVLKRVLRERHAAAARQRPGQEPAGQEPAGGSAAARPSGDALRGWLGEWLESRAGLAPGSLAPGLSFFDHGLTSALAVQLAGDLSSWTGLRLPATLLWSAPTPDALIERLAPEPEGAVPSGAPTPDADDPVHRSEEELVRLLADEIAAARQERSE